MKSIDNICIEKITRILGELVTGTDITNILAKNRWKDHDTETGVRAISTKRKRLEASMIHEINTKNSTQPFFRLIEEIMNPVEFANAKDTWYTNLENINFILRFYGYELTDGGKVQSTTTTKTYTEGLERSTNLLDKLKSQGVHENIIKYCTPELLKENYFHAILEASKSVFDRIRIMTNSSLDGNTLINEAFVVKRPSIIIKGNLLSNDNEKSLYLGLKSLLNTICYLYRNPTAHSPKLFNEKNESDALTAFMLISLAHHQLDNCEGINFLD